MHVANIKRVKGTYYDPWTRKELGGFDYPFDRTKIRNLRRDIVTDLQFFRRKTGLRKPRIKLEFVC